MTEAEVVDLEAQGVNMFGIQPCPKCRSVYRYIALSDNKIHCDDCGLVSEWRKP